MALHWWWPELGGRRSSRCACPDGISTAFPPRAGSAAGWPTRCCGMLARRGADRCSLELAPAPAWGSARRVCDCELVDSCLHLCRGPLAAALPSARSRRTPGRCLGRDASWLRVRSRWRARCTPRMRRPASRLAPPSNGASLEEAAAKAGGSSTAHLPWARPLAPWRRLGAREVLGGSLSLEAANMT